MQAGGFAVFQQRMLFHGGRFGFWNGNFEGVRLQPEFDGTELQSLAFFQDIISDRCAVYKSSICGTKVPYFDTA